MDETFRHHENPQSMGSCLCKRKRARSDARSAAGGSSDSTERSRLDGRSRPRQRRSSLTEEPVSSLHRQHIGIADGSERLTVNVTNDVKELIKQTLQLIRSLVSNEQEPPTPLLKLNLIADKEGGWVLVVMCLIEVVPEDDPLGPAVITLFLDESPLPTKETVIRLITRHMRLDEQRSVASSAWHRNACIVLGCLAEKLAGSSSVQICTNATLNYLLGNLKPGNDTQVIMYAMIALEKFAQTSENRLTICRRLEQLEKHPLIILESWLNDPKVEDDWLKQQVAFCAQWSLDNIFVSDSRELSYLRCNVENINAMLNHEDVSEYLKIGSNGLEARCDVSSFESVRCTFEATEGVWFYEALILTPGVMQIGFATKHSRFCNHEGYGIGDDECSLAYDGCRQLLWHNAQCQKHEHEPWKAGDYLGCLLDIPGRYVQFYLNGRPLQQPHREFIERCAENADSGFFAAASFMSFQQCRFNFGHKPFRFPPSLEFKTFNDCGSLTSEQKTILPRRRKMELLAQISIPDDSCHLCYSNPIDTVLKPCGHSGICSTCAEQVKLCPLCRMTIYERVHCAHRPAAEERGEHGTGVSRQQRLTTLV